MYTLKVSKPIRKGSYYSLCIVRYCYQHTRISVARPPKGLPEAGDPLTKVFHQLSDKYCSQGSINVFTSKYPLVSICAFEHVSSFTSYTLKPYLNSFLSIFTA